MDLSERCLGCHRKRFLGPPFMVVLWLFLRWSSNSGAAAIRLQDDGGYVDLVVAVHEALPVELELVEQLKAWCSFVMSPSRCLPIGHQLSTATHLASVRANAPIRIVSNEEAQWPRTVQPRSCGQPGEYTLLPADALRNAQADYLVVHEWAHLRFGVFDEFGFPKDPLYPAVYTRGKQVLSNTCSARIVTSQQKEDGAPCGIIEGTLETSGCLDFEPVPELTDARSSIMFLPPLPTCRMREGENEHQASGAGSKLQPGLPSVMECRLGKPGPLVVVAAEQPTWWKQGRRGVGGAPKMFAALLIGEFREELLPLLVCNHGGVLLISTIEVCDAAA
ncbi:hypothetical protein MRX96_027979 [Rhipicephalus microplus]